MPTDRCVNTCRQKCCAKGSEKEVKIQEFMYRDTTNVKVKVKQSRYRPGVAQRVPGS